MVRKPSNLNGEVTEVVQEVSPQRKAGQLLRRRRIEVGLTVTETARRAGLTRDTLSWYEAGTHWCPARVVVRLASALGLPIAALLVETPCVIAEVRVSDNTLEEIRREGRPAAQAAAMRLASTLEALLIAEATRPPVDLSPGARGKQRRSREQLLQDRDAGIAAAVRRREEKRAERAAAKVIAEDGGGSP